MYIYFLILSNVFILEQIYGGGGCSLAGNMAESSQLNYLGSTSLHYASEKGHQHVVQLLLDRGSNIDQKNNEGECILSIYLCIHHTIHLTFH